MVLQKAATASAFRCIAATSSPSASGWYASSASSLVIYLPRVLFSAAFQSLAARLGDPHAAEHRMIDCLAEALWEAQRQNRPPDEAAYLERLRKL